MNHFNLCKKLSSELKNYIFEFISKKKKCEYCHKYNFEWNMKNILYNSEYFFWEKKERFYVYKCLDC